jgi:hypothetical protein
MNVSPLPFALNDANFLKRLRAAAENSARVTITTHAAQRMKQRKVSFAQVLTCLQKGTVVEPAALTQYGDWKATVGCKVAGDDIQVAVAIERDASADWCVVITVMN